MWMEILLWLFPLFSGGTEHPREHKRQTSGQVRKHQAPFFGNIFGSSAGEDINHIHIFTFLKQLWVTKQSGDEPAPPGEPSRCVRARRRVAQIFPGGTRRRERKSGNRMRDDRGSGEAGRERGNVQGREEERGGGVRNEQWQKRSEEEAVIIAFKCPGQHHAA